jgi:hypothetical protein
MHDDHRKHGGLKNKSTSPVPEEARLNIVEEGDGAVMYCEVKQGRRYKRIAKRYPGKGWINLEPGYVVRGSEPGGDRESLTIEYNPAFASVQ